MDKLVNGLNPVIYKINFNGSQGLFEMSAEYSAYAGEDEVLIQDGLEYTIKNIQKVYFDKEKDEFYHEITLQHPPDKS